ncbi:MAG TPA: hypothetical protein VFA05_05850 [Gaiellaceae bacterium]|nr:hypothetical protein [Gaiellaceae bacterium]
MSRRLQILLAPDQYAFLAREADRSSVSMGELIRRAIDTVYAPAGSQVLSVIRHVPGRRAGKPFARYEADAAGGDRSASPSQ